MVKLQPILITINNTLCQYKRQSNGWLYEIDWVLFTTNFNYNSQPRNIRNKTSQKMKTLSASHFQNKVTLLLLVTWQLYKPIQVRITFIIFKWLWNLESVKNMLPPLQAQLITNRIQWSRERPKKCFQSFKKSESNKSGGQKNSRLQCDRGCCVI